MLAEYCTSSYRSETFLPFWNSVLTSMAQCYQHTAPARTDPTPSFPSEILYLHAWHGVHSILHQLIQIRHLPSLLKFCTYKCGTIFPAYCTSSYRSDTFLPFWNSVLTSAARYSKHTALAHTDPTPSFPSEILYLQVQHDIPSILYLQVQHDIPSILYLQVQHDIPSILY